MKDWLDTFDFSKVKDDEVPLHWGTNGILGSLTAGNDREFFVRAGGMDWNGSNSVAFSGFDETTHTTRRELAYGEIAVQGPGSGVGPTDRLVLRNALKPSDTVAHLKNLIDVKIGVPPSQQLLIFNNATLEDDGETLGSREVGDGAVITLRTRMPDPNETVLSRSALNLNSAFDNLKRVAFRIRANMDTWKEERANRVEVAQDKVQVCRDAMEATAARLQGELNAMPPVNTNLHRRSPFERRSPSEDAGACDDAAAEFERWVRGAVAALSRHRGEVECAQQQCSLEQNRWHAQKEAEFALLSDMIEALRVEGDANNVDTRSLPVTWTLSLKWLFPPSEEHGEDRPIMDCFLCMIKVYTDEMGDHMDKGCTANGHTPAEGEEFIVPADKLPKEGEEAPKKKDGGTQMGGDQSVICSISGVLIDAEDTQVCCKNVNTSAECEMPLMRSEETGVAQGERDGAQAIADRNARWHSLDTDKLCRLPLYHTLLQSAWGRVACLTKEAGFSTLRGFPACTDSFASSCDDGDGGDGGECGAGSRALVELVACMKRWDPHGDESWVQDKQNIYWLMVHVKQGKWNGKPDTPASLIVRACDAFELRPALGIPEPTLVPDAELPRMSPRTVLAEAAGITIDELRHADSAGWLWLSYGAIGRMVKHVAAKLLASGLALGSVVAICGYVQGARGGGGIE